MPRKIHMRDQVGTNKVEEIMRHYGLCPLELWAVKFAVVGVVLVVMGAYWS
jgi:hypothetical protein